MQEVRRLAITFQGDVLGAGPRDEAVSTQSPTYAATTDAPNGRTAIAIPTHYPAARRPSDQRIWRLKMSRLGRGTGTRSLGQVRRRQAS